MSQPTPGQSDPTQQPSTLDSPVRRRIVAYLTEQPRIDGAAPGMTATDLAVRLGLHVTTVRFHLDQLVAAALVTATMERREGVGRPRKLYCAAGRPQRGAGPALGSFEALARLLTNAWRAAGSGDAPPTPHEAGAAWAHEHAAAVLALNPMFSPAPARSPGQWLGKIGMMLDLLREWGYRSSVRTGLDDCAIEVELVDCPFMELARTDTDVICGIHEGLLAGALDTLGEKDVEIELIPFVTRHTCLARFCPAITEPAATTAVPSELFPPSEESR